MKSSVFAYCLAAALLLTPASLAEESKAVTIVTMADQQEEEAYDLYVTAKEANLRSRPGKKAGKDEDDEEFEEN